MTLGWVLIEAAHSHAMHAPYSNITQFYNRIKKKRGSSKGIVATGSKILRVIYWMLKSLYKIIVRATGRVMNHEGKNLAC